MSIKDDITAKLKTAMLERDEFLTGVLRDLKSAILNEEIKQVKRDEGLSDEEIEKVIFKSPGNLAKKGEQYDKQPRFFVECFQWTCWSLLLWKGFCPLSFVGFNLWFL